MDRLRSGLPGSAHHGLHIQVRFGCRRRPDPDRDVGLAGMRSIGIGIAVDRDAAQTLRFQGSDDAPGDFATIGDEDTVEAHGHILKTPKRGSGSGLRTMTSRASPSRSRV